MAPPAPVLITRWASRDALLPPALRPGYAKIDGRAFADLVADAAHFSRFVRYFDLSGVQDGNWEGLVAADPTVLLALFATVDSGNAAAAAEALLWQVRGEPDPWRREELLLRLLLDMVFLAVQIERWLAGAAPFDEPSRQLVERMVAEDLAPRVRRLLGMAAAFQRAGRLRPELGPVPPMSPGWTDEAGAEECPPDPPEHPCSDGWLDRLLDVIEDFLDGLSALAAKAAGEIEPSLPSGAHPPHVALLLAFLRIFGGARGDLNRLPGRIMDFYQQSVLRERPQKAQPDRMFLSFVPVPAPAAPLPEIAAGTLFPAGQDAAGSAVAFAADEALTVTGAVPTGLRLWRSRTGPGGLRVLSGLIPVPTDGAVGARLFDPSGLSEAAVGLVVASPLLALATGRRCVTLRFKEIDLPAGLDDQAFAKLLKGAFALEISAASGWLPIGTFDTDESRVQGSTGEAVFRFTLAAEDSALAPWPEGGPALPAVRLSLQQGEVGNLSPLKCLGAATFGSLRIEVDVKDLGGLSVTTPSGGPGPVTSGMSAFGTPPMPGDRLRISHPALAVGQLDRVELGLTWLALPSESDGFSGYYRQYVIGPDRSLPYCSPPLFTNFSFKVSVAATIGAKGREVDKYLFQELLGIESGDELGFVTGGALRPTSWFCLSGCSPIPDGVGNPRDSVVVTLTAPAWGFGDLLYPVNVAYATAQIATAEMPPPPPPPPPCSPPPPSTLPPPPPSPDPPPAPPSSGPLFRLWRWLLWLRLWFSRPQRRLAGWSPDPADAALPPPLTPAQAAVAFMPNPPWRPALGGIELNYGAHVAWPGLADDGEAIAFFHVRPEGLAEVALSGRPRLLPALPIEACFDLAVAGWPAGEPLSLLFVMGPPSGGAVSAVSWYWLGADGAQPLRPLADGTSGLTGTGILTFAGQEAPPPVAWLRAKPKGVTDGFPPVLAILPNGLTATRLIGGEETQLPPIPAGTVVQPPGTQGIAAVVQPLPSFGGSPAEDSATLPARTAARLRHRERGILDWDVERLVLERFPDIARVRVLPARARDGAAPAPGHMLVVVIPGPGGPNPPDPDRPCASPELKGAIRDWLAERCSAFSRIHVVDPAYDPVDVAVAACFTVPGGAAELRSDLSALLSPWAEPSLDLPDEASDEALRACLARFAAERPYVEGLASLSARLSEPVGAGQWRVPVAGTIEVTALARPLAVGC